MKIIQNFLTFLILSLSMQSLWAQEIPLGKDRFLFTHALSNPKRPLLVHTYRPEAANEEARVVFVMTGIQRDSENYLNDWISYADQYGFILVVPEYSKDYYDNNEYTFGDVMREPPEWGFMTLEHLFDEVKKRAHLKAEKYSIYGHSAGAQFVHRQLFFMGDKARTDIVAIANAGWYTLPIYAKGPLYDFPLSLSEAVTPEANLKKVFGKTVYILLGDKDKDPNAKSLNRMPPAMAQGDFRFERGQNFFRIARYQAEAMKTLFAWKLFIVEGVGHDSVGMSKIASKIIGGEIK